MQQDKWLRVACTRRMPKHQKNGPPKRACARHCASIRCGYSLELEANAQCEAVGLNAVLVVIGHVVDRAVGGRREAVTQSGAVGHVALAVRV